jgi:hypothetical protein
LLGVAELVRIIAQAVADLEVLVVAVEEELITGLHRCRVTFQDY